MIRRTRDDTLSKTMLQSPDIASEFLLPPHVADWQDRTYGLNGHGRKAAQSPVTGLRLAPTELRISDDPTINAFNTDAPRLVDTVRRLRKKSANLVLWDNVLSPSQRRGERRARFGLKVDECFADDDQAAAHCHRQLNRAIRDAGCSAVPKKPERPGFEALRDWTETARLVRRRWIWPWLVLLGLAAVLAFLLWLRHHDKDADESAALPADAPAPTQVVDNHAPFAEPVATLTDVQSRPPESSVPEPEPAPLQPSPNPIDVVLERLVEVRGGNNGALQVFLSWSNHNDLDLHVVPPNGREINFSTKESAGGKLDLDVNVSAPFFDDPVKHVAFDRNPPHGVYKVFAHHYETKYPDKSWERADRNPFRIGIKLSDRSSGQTLGSRTFDRPDGIRLKQGSDIVTFIIDESGLRFPDDGK